ncbi:TonB-dependent receptor [uncultured Azonexus sp.]|uniref:TonB-dependent receptor domain-containing protein n=1 Tax=uncultured Azonexus sp. TaxID=520307 RepID=UPI00261F4DCB|nr:TonB-dependent receptor [uncultured Azonexus sp.]
MNSRLKPLAVLLPLAFCQPLQATEQLASLDTMVVTATRQPMRVSEVLTDVSVIERNEIEAAGHTNLEQILAAQPGIQIVANGSWGANSSLLIRGTNAKHVLLLVDGMRVGSATSGEPTWSRIPVAQIERIEIIRGPASAMYGSDAIGGVVQIFTRRSEEALHLSAEAGAGSYGTRNGSASLSGKRNGWQYGVTLSHETTDGFNSRPWTATANPDKDGFRNQATSARLGYTFAPGHELMLSALHAEGRNSYDGTGVTVDWVNQTRNGNASLVLKNRLTSAWNSTLTVGRSIDHSKNLRNGLRNSQFNTEQDMYAWQNDLSGSLGNFLIGFERTEQAINTSGNYPKTQRRNDAVQLGWNRGFGAHRLQASTRYDDDSLFGDKTTGSLAYGYRFSNNWRASASVGTAFKAPTFNELYYPLTGTFVGNPAVQPESAINRELSIHYEAGNQAISLTWYLNRVKDMIAWTRVGALNQPTNIDSARLEGATLSWQGKLSSLDLQASYDWLDAIDRRNDRQLARRARHSAAISVGQTLDRWDWRAEMLGSGKRYEYSGTTRVELDGYALTNLYAAYRFAPEWSIFARVNNLFDRDYILADTYATPGRNAFIGIRYSPK